MESSKQVLDIYILSFLHDNLLPSLCPPLKTEINLFFSDRLCGYNLTSTTLTFSYQFVSCTEGRGFRRGLRKERREKRFWRHEHRLARFQSERVLSSAFSVMNEADW